MLPSFVAFVDVLLKYRMVFIRSSRLIVTMRVWFCAAGAAVLLSRDAPPCDRVPSDCDSEQPE